MLPNTEPVNMTGSFNAKSAELVTVTLSLDDTVAVAEVDVTPLNGKFCPLTAEVKLELL